MIGIYKITSPSGKVYIGQSRDIFARFLKYQRLSCKRQPKIYNSLKKYGVEAHQFGIIEFCKLEDLNVCERYWQEHYDSVLNGLNCSYVETDVLPKVLSQDTIAKRSKSSLGHKRNVGRKQTPEWIAKRQASTTWTHHTEESKKKIGDKSRGRKSSIETTVKRQLTHPGNKPIIQLDKNGVIIATFISTAHACRETGINYQNIQSVLKLKTNTAGGYKWKYSNEP